MATVKISELPAGQVVGNITVNGAQTFKSGATSGAAAVGIVLDTVNALSTDTAKPLSIRTAGVEQAALERQSGAYWLSLGSTVIAGGSTPVVNASIQLNGAASKIAMGSSNSIQWTLAVADAFNTADTSIHRYAAGVVRFGDARTSRGLETRGFDSPDAGYGSACLGRSARGWARLAEARIPACWRKRRFDSVGAGRSGQRGRLRSGRAVRQGAF